MKIEERIRQSAVRVRSGARLIGFLLLVAIAAFAFGVTWLGKLAGVLAVFFAVITLVEAWNVWRLRRRRES
jgi:Flp pilus assembly protein TadB